MKKDEIYVCENCFNWKNGLKCSDDKIHKHKPNDRACTYGKMIIRENRRREKENRKNNHDS